MKGKREVMIIVIVLAALLVIAGGGYALLKDQVDAVGTATDEAAADRIEAPDFTVYTADGQPVKLSDFSGKPVIINFWASWCGPCKSEMPDFQKVYEAYGDRVDFLMLNMTYGDETIEVARTFVEESGYTFPVYFDTTLEAASLYGASTIPTTFALDRNGRVYSYAKAVLSEDALVSVLDKLLEE